VSIIPALSPHSAGRLKSSKGHSARIACGGISFAAGGYEMAAEIELIVSAVTGAITGGAVKPLLAPADALAEHWKERVRTRLERVSDAASRKQQVESAVVDERIAFRVFMEAAFTDDEVVAEYLAGVVAGTASAQDDGASALSQIGRLSSLALRMHYVAYRELWRMAQSGEIREGRFGWSWGRALYFPESELLGVFGEDFGSVAPRLALAGRALEREALLQRQHVAAFTIVEAGGEIQFKTDRNPLRICPPERGIVVETCPSGVELFLWASGLSTASPDSILRVTQEQIGLTPSLPNARGQPVVELPRIEM
jgi:hypothetical protein